MCTIVGSGLVLSLVGVISTKYLASVCNDRKGLDLLDGVYPVRPGSRELGVSSNRQIAL